MEETIKLSIEDILSLKELEKSEILSGEDYLNRKVNKVNLMVDPDIKLWVNPEDFLLSTSFFYKSMDVEEQIEFIKMLIKSNISCLGIKFSPHYEQLPDKVIEFARHSKFVIISIDYNQSFTNIISSVYENLFERQMGLLNKISKVHDNAMDLLLEGGNIFDILNTLEDEMKSRIFVIDNYYDKYYFNENDMNERFLESIDVFKRNNLANDITKGILKEIPVGDKIFTRYVFPLSVKNEVYGYVISFVESAQYNNMNAQLIESVSTVISLYFYNQLSHEEVEISYHSEFLEKIFSEDKNEVEKAMDRSIFFNMIKEGTYQVVQFIIEDELNENQQIFKHLHKIKSYLNNFEQPNILAVVNNRINLLYKYDKNSYDKMVSHFSNKTYFGQSYRIVFGRKVNHLSKVNRSYGDCKKISDNFGLLFSQNIIDYENLGVYRLLIDEHLSEEINDFYKINLKKLVDYDEKRSTDLVGTLEAYFNCNGNLRKMSESLYTHYNTILYRMERIETIIEKKMDNEDDRYNLQTALKIYKLLEKQKMY